MGANEQRDNKIDFVIPYVDGADPAWIARRTQYSGQPAGDQNANRYRDWGTLKYWFRGVEKFAPWVNRIFFISDQQVPDWLNVNHPKLSVIDHRDYIPEDCLPTFSSHPIELNMHRIKGLSEQFVYFNDDTFLIRPTGQEMFFKDGLPCDSAVLSPVILERKDCIGQVCANDMAVINTYFTKSEVMKPRKKWYTMKYGTQVLRTLFLSPWHHLPGFYNDHLPQPFLKSTFDTVWEKEPELLHRVSRNRFRDYGRDVNQWLMRYWQFCEGKFVPVSPRRGVCYTDVCEEALATIRNQSHAMICMNDSTETDFEQYKKKLADAFESILPEKSGFEK